MIKLIETDVSIVKDILIQQKISFQIIHSLDIVRLNNNDILFWDLKGLASHHSNQDIIDFLNRGGKIIIAPDENYKILTRIESKNHKWCVAFLKKLNDINKKEQILVLTEGKIHQDSNIKCTLVQFGYLEYFRAAIQDDYDYNNLISKNLEYNYSAAAVNKPNRIFREKFYNEIKKTNIDISQLSLPTYLDKSVNDMTVFVPDNLHKSYCSIILETDADPYVSVIGEKTFKPIVLEKIWIALADSNYYNTMKFLGFDIFEDIFDLSFSEELDVDLRVDKFVKELVRMNSYDFKKLSIDLNERILENKYNLSRARSIDYHHKFNTIFNLVKNKIEV